MPRPANFSTDATLRPDLGTVAWEYYLNASQRGYVGLQIMPVFEVPEASATYPIIPIESLIRIQETEVSHTGDYNRADWDFKDGHYSCKENGWEELIHDREAKLYQRFFDIEMIGSERCTDILLRNVERRIAAKTMSPGNAAGVKNAAASWSDIANSQILEDITLAKREMRYTSGLKPNALVMSETTFENAYRSEKFAAYLSPTTPHLIEDNDTKKRLLAAYLNVPRIIVGDEIMDISKKGKAASLQPIWNDNYVALIKISMGGRDLREPAWGRTFVWTEYAPETVNIQTYREKGKRTVIQAWQDTDEAIITQGANYLVKVNLTA